MFFVQLFRVDAPENRFIDFYRNTDDWLKLADNKKRFALIVVVGLVVYQLLVRAARPLIDRLL